VLRYESETGLFYWREPRKRILAGQKAGRLQTSGYIGIKFGKRLYLAHRLAWFYMTGEWPLTEVDHKNNIRTDNRWKNLRKATRSQNAGNRLLSDKNTPGVKGVTWDRARNKWRAFIKADGKSCTIGRYDSFDDACEARELAAERYFGEYAKAEGSLGCGGMPQVNMVDSYHIPIAGPDKF